MGQIRDLEHEWSRETAQRIATENTTLKQRVRQLTTENRTLAERLRAARSDNRFADRRIAQLEAQLAEQVEARGVRLARERGWSWEQIGDALGVFRQSIHAKYGKREQ